VSNEDQIAYWNGEAGERWARDDAIMERLLQPVTEALLDHAALPEGGRALEIGCGGGSQSRLLAERLGAAGSVLGVDISGPMLAVARDNQSRAIAGSAGLDFMQADASTQDFGGDRFDLLFSRFGIMFFDQPVSAFTHLRGALADGGRMAFCCWQSLKDNVWTMIPLQAALQHIPPPEAPEPHAPGPFAFADPERVTGILSEAGFVDIEFHSFNSELRFSESATLTESVRGLAEIGPIGRLLAEQSEEIKEKVLVSMEEVLAPFYQDGALVMPVAIWFVTAGVG
jgi:SAM-dependent methyltransferase